MHGSIVLVCIGPCRKAFIVYCKDDNPPAQELSDYLRHCAIDCDVDAYHSTDDVTNWNQWIEEKVDNCCKSNGYILLLCGEKLSEFLNVSPENNTIYMRNAFVERLTLLSLIQDSIKNVRFLPILIDHEDTDLIPSTLKLRSHYTIKTAAILEGCRDCKGIEKSLKSEENQSFHGLVAKITGQKENHKPPVATCFYSKHEK